MSAAKHKRITLAQIAEAVGMSPATVSLALRNDPRIAKDTVARVRTAADKLGYRPDPHLSHLMGYLRGGTMQSAGSVLALLSDWPEKELREHTYMNGMVRGIMERGEQLGYRLELFQKSDQLSYRRIQSILTARGIQGVIILPHKQASFTIDNFDFNKFSSVCIGYGMVSPELHRVASQQTRAAMEVTEKVVDNGYKRVGLVMERTNNVRTHHRYMSGVLGQLVATGHSLDVPPLILDNEDAESVQNWLLKYKPDAVIAASLPLDRMLRSIGLIAGKHIGLAMINYIGPEEVARLETPYHALGQGSVNMVHSQLCFHELGVPEIPQVLSVPGKWIAGSTLPHRDKLKRWPAIKTKLRP
ncbi:MAG: LacI family transcriptional regulator [Verrucomicrobia bacterium]|nr:LacI family transcriptional regulator [Verrucomicrobiota bacterium]